MTEDGLGLLVATLMRRRNLSLVFGLAALMSAFVFAASFVLNPRYEATAVVVQANSRGATSSLSRLASSVGGLAGLDEFASLGNADQAATRELLGSRAILRALVERHDLLPVLFSKRWDNRSGGWRKVLRADPPSIGDAIELLDRDVRRVVVDRETGAVKVTMRWTDPGAAAAWANSLIELVNEQARSQAIQEAEASVSILTREAEATDNVELRASLFNLIGSQIRVMSVARSRESFALRFVDPAVAPDLDEYYFPNRVLMAVSSGLFTAVATLFWILMRHEPRWHS